MRIAEVIGTVTLGKPHPSMAGASFRLVVPLSLDNLTGASNSRGEELVAIDPWGAGIGSRVAVSEGREAAQPFDPEGKPVDAYVAAILEAIDVRPLNEAT